MEMYDLGLVIGRFQMLHNGHVYMIKNALNLCNRVVVYIGSSQESGTEKNPFSYQVRRDMIEKSFPIEYAIGKIIVCPLPDAKLGDNYNWGKYVLDNFEKEFGKQPDLYVTGVEKERPSWFSEKDAPKMSELRLSRSSINCSATECRNSLLSEDDSYWKANVPYQLYKLKEYYKLILTKVLKEEDK